MPRDPAAVALAMIAAEPDESPPSADELTALAQAHLDTIRAQSVEGGNKVTIQLDVHRYSAAEALAKHSNKRCDSCSPKRSTSRSLAGRRAEGTSSAREKARRRG